jgi:hypothetical protein
MEIRRMWINGPLRCVARERSKLDHSTSYIPLDLDGLFGGPYVCDACESQVTGLYRVNQPSGPDKWLCGRCRDSQKPKEAVPEGLRRYREGRNG